MRSNSHSADWIWPALLVMAASIIGFLILVTSIIGPQDLGADVNYLIKTVQRLAVRHPPGFREWSEYAEQHVCEVLDYSVLERALHPFKRQGIRLRELDSLFKDVPSHPVDFHGNGTITGPSLSALAIQLMEWLCEPFLKALPHLRFRIYINIMDEPQISLNETVLRPLLSFTTDGKHADIPFPYLYTINPGWTDETVIEHLSKPWSEKKKMVIWRGSTTGAFSYIKGDDSWRRTHRFRMVKKYSNGSLPAVLNQNPRVKIDVGFTQFVQCDQEICEQQRREYRSVPEIPFEEMGDAQYILDVDGNSFSQRFPRLLTLNSVVIKWTQYTEWFTEWIQPGRDYIAIKSVDEVAAAIQGLLHDPITAEQIARNGVLIARSRLRPVDMRAYMFRLLVEMASLY